MERIYRLATATGHLARLVVFGSFITAKPWPNDVDVFLLMADTFDVDQLAGEERLLLEYADAQAHLGASVFWLRRSAALGGEQAAVEHWQLKRDGSRRGWSRLCGTVAGVGGRDCTGVAMIANDQGLNETLERIARFQAQVAHLRNVESNPANYHAAVSGFLAEIDRMQLEVREYLSLHPTEFAGTT